MSHSLSLEQATAFAPHRSAQPVKTTVHGKHRPPVATVSPFVERRQMAQLNAERSLRSPVVLAFAGVVGGLLLSAALIVLVAGVLMVCAVSWPAASQHCIATVVFVFGTAGLVLYWDVAHAQAKMLNYMEPIIERRAYYLHLSSLDALENLRNLNNWARLGTPGQDETPSRQQRRSTVESIQPEPVRAPQPTSERSLAGNRADAFNTGEQQLAAHRYGRKPLDVQEKTPADHDPDRGEWVMPAPGWSGVPGQSAAC